MTYYDVITSPTKSEVMKNFINLNNYGDVTDIAEFESYGLLRADLSDNSIGIVLGNKNVISIEKPRKIMRN